MSLSGLFNIGHDIGGFFGPKPDAEMLIRWTQACCLVPRMIMNSWKADGSVNSPWLHPKATEAIREAVRLRLHLMPYLYTLMHQASTQHVPVLRPTFFHFADDAHCWLDNDEMMVGPDLLVAPVFAPDQRERTLYLPKGPHAEGWYECGSDTYWPGGSTVAVRAELERLPLFVRAGALLATTDTRDDARLTEEPSRALRFYPKQPGTAPASSKTEVFEDDGLQQGDETYRHAVLHAEATSSNSALTVRVALSGSWPLPYDRIRVVLPAAERRSLELLPGPVTLVR